MYTRVLPASACATRAPESVLMSKCTSLCPQADCGLASAAGFSANTEKTKRKTTRKDLILPPGQENSRAAEARSQKTAREPLSASASPPRLSCAAHQRGA